jgi:hypothetical protein
VMRLLDAMVTRTQGDMSQSAALLQAICAAAADPVTGEFEVPMAPARVAAMRQTILDIGGQVRERGGEKSSKAVCSALSLSHSLTLVHAVLQIDESTVAQVYAWIRKSSDDGLDGMVVILQRVLQLYAACALVPGGVPRAQESTALRALEEVRMDVQCAVLSPRQTPMQNMQNMQIEPIRVCAAPENCLD